MPGPEIRFSQLFKVASPGIAEWRTIASHRTISSVLKHFFPQVLHAKYGVRRKPLPATGHLLTMTAASPPRAWPQKPKSPEPFAGNQPVGNPGNNDVGGPHPGGLPSEPGFCLPTPACGRDTPQGRKGLLAPANPALWVFRGGGEGAAMCLWGGWVPGGPRPPAGLRPPVPPRLHRGDGVCGASGALRAGQTFLSKAKKYQNFQTFFF